MSIIRNSLLMTPEGYQISRSVRLRSSASAYFNRTPASATNTKTWTWSGWFKNSTTATDNTFIDSLVDVNNETVLRTSGNQISFAVWTSGAYTVLATTPAVFRDPSAWYHIVFVLDTTQATNSNGVKVYVNGVQQTLTFSNYTQNATTLINTTNSQRIGRNFISGGDRYTDGYLTEINFIDGQALTPSSFGETDAVTGVWKPKKYVGTYGTNGFYLNFSDNSAATATTIGKDYSGNGNNWTPNNISLTAGATYDSMIDVPTMYADGGNGRGNYCVLNAINYLTTAPTNANLRLNLPSGGTVRNFGTIGVTSGKWYWETTITAFNPSPFNGYMLLGATTNIAASGTGYYCYVGSNDVSVAGYKTNGTNSAYGANYTAGDVVGVALDLDSGTITFYKNNVSQGVAYSSLPTSTYFPFIYNDGSASNPTTYDINFGQRPFSYTPPTGFKALNTQNLPDSTIKKGNQYFDVKLYTGNGSTQSITGIGFAPDLVWTKARSSAISHGLFDTVRGAGKAIYSNATNAEYDYGTTTAGELYQFTSDGFNLGSSGNFNANGVTNVAWNWKESASAGFDIVTYTGDSTVGRTISHSLGVTPKMVIVKRRDTASDWAVSHASLPNNSDTLYLDLTASASTYPNRFDRTGFTSAVFKTGSATVPNEVNANGGTFVAYLFAEVAGFSKFGSYTGNGSTDGPFVFCGFRPRWVMIKQTSGASDWIILDTSRDPYNMEINYLVPNTSGAEASGASVQLDGVSNGIKIRGTWAGMNASGSTYIFAAFAENPFKNSLAR